MKYLINVVVQSGQYEQASQTITIKVSTNKGLQRRLKQLAKEHAVYGDNWAGYINALVKIASPCDKYLNNTIIGGKSCDPHPIADWLTNDECSYNTFDSMTITKALTINTNSGNVAKEMLGK